MEFNLEVKEHGSGMPTVWENSVLSFTCTGSKPQIDMIRDVIDSVLCKVGHTAKEEVNHE